MKSTRLLILGAVKIFQPVHGYFVRRELLSWRADQWASVNPGSIYNALRTLTKERFLEEVPGESDTDGRGRTSYRLTADGETEFITTLHDAFWSLNEYAPDLMYAALGFMSFLPRAEVMAALEHRIAQIDALKAGLVFKQQTLERDPSVPEHTPEILKLATARLDGERGWAQDLLGRIREGALSFADEAERAPAGQRE
jgi:DNA-binding PadR family transcriptional regulator